MPSARRVRLAYLAPILAILWAPQVLGWGADGHRIAGMIAWHYLSEKAKAGVKDLLGDESLGSASCWADEIRNDKTYNWAKPLHYVNVPRNAQAVDLQRDCRQGKCVVEAITKYTLILKDPGKPKAERAEALKFLCHFVQDVHQPLHVSYEDDKGGNSVKVRFLGRETNFHSLWDSGLIDHKLGRDSWMKLAESWQAGITPAELKQWQSAKPDPSAWANESLTITRRLYADLPKSGDLDEQYFQRNIGTVEDRLTAAGVRLAALLNAIFEGQDIAVSQQPAATAPSAATPTTATSSTLAIVSLLPDPAGDDAGHEEVSIANSGDKPVSLKGWKLKDRSGNVFALDGTVEAHATLKIVMTGNSMPLNNTGDDVSLVDPSGNEVQKVSYERGQARSGKAVEFRP